ncbi:hypothetical protein AVDCRST_MAG94-1249 [uncultured Leptolyngbya sp.]|uniref:Uncharacterized protein n=1 Tax=uncultured Leptolyngbya sp. TaxID=332963 RepID=A0A6J4KWS2_9CYAN|nr:hypothetical protein AVDCRST_MAG94-1249 [uncultured Leptolyngbya sp.]
MVYSPSAFLSQFFHIPVAEEVAAVQTHTAQDDGGHKVPPLEQARLGHEGEIPQAQASSPTMKAVFATKPT